MSVAIPSPSSLAHEEVILEAGRVSKNYWRDLWRYRDLFQFLAWRDISVRYKQAALGVAWAVIQPLTTMAIFTLVFGRLAGMSKDTTIPYPLVVFAATLPWQFFATSLGACSNSLVVNQNLLRKIYFPRLIVPVSAMIVSLVDFITAFVLFLLLMLYFVATGQFTPTWHIIFMPLFLMLAFGISLGAGLWFATLNVEYRDFRYIVPFMVQIGMYVSPVGWQSSRIPEQWQTLYALNPMVGVIDGFRWALLGGDRNQLNLMATGISVAFLIVLCITGLRYFRAMERRFADVV